MNENIQKQSTQIKITGLWRKTLTSGGMMLSGTLSPTARIVIFPNKHKIKDTDPDYVLYIESPLAKEKVALDAGKSTQSTNEWDDFDEVPF